MTKQEDPLDDSMTVVRTGTCDTITKKSRLTYHVGILPLTSCSMPNNTIDEYGEDWGFMGIRFRTVFILMILFKYPVATKLGK